MDCQHVQQAILDSFDEPTSAAIQWEIDAHVSGCEVCAAFAAKQRAIDARLTATLRPPEMRPAVRAMLRRRLNREIIPAWLEALPDIVHFGSFGLATLLCAALAPFETTVVFGVGATAALLTYVLLTTVRSSLDSIEQPDR